MFRPWETAALPICIIRRKRCDQRLHSVSKPWLKVGLIGAALFDPPHVRSAMNIASVFDWFARESLRAAEHTEDPRQREILLKLAVLWEAAAQRSRDEASPQSTPPNTDERAHSEDDRAA